MGKGSEIRAVIAQVGKFILASALGVGLGAALVFGVVLPIVGLGEVQRIREMGEHLDGGFPRRPVAVFLGNSSIVEGIDASVVAGVASGWHVENLAINGCDLTETRVLLGKLLAAKPDVVVLSYRCQDLGTLRDIPIDKAYALNLAGFPDAWPDAWDHRSLPGLSDATYAALRASKTRAWLHFRSYPLTALNARLRAGLRKGVRTPDPDDWTSPFDLELSIGGWRLERHLEVILNECDSRLAHGSREGLQEIELAVVQILDSGADVLLTMVPVHPRLRDALAAYNEMMRDRLRKLAAADGLLLVDAVDLVDADDFADAVHLNARGRGRFSELVGARLTEITGNNKAHVRSR